jgi:hypothetical protein
MELGFREAEASLCHERHDVILQASDQQLFRLHAPIWICGETRRRRCRRAAERGAIASAQPRISL